MRVGFGASTCIDCIVVDLTVVLSSVLETAFLAGVDGTYAPCVAPFYKRFLPPRESTDLMTLLPQCRTYMGSCSTRTQAVARS